MSMHNRLHSRIFNELSISWRISGFSPSRSWAGFHARLAWLHHLRSIQQLLTILAILVAVAGLIGCVPHNSSSQQSTASPLTLLEGDLGTLWAGASCPKTICIKNITDQPVNIASFSSSCPCLVLSLPSEPIPGNTAVTIPVRVDLPLVPNTQNTSFAFAAEVTYRAKGQRTYSSPWKLGGKVRPLVATLPGYLDFGRVPIAESNQVSRDLLIETVCPVVAILPSCAEPDVDVQIHKRAPTKFSMKVTLRDPQTPGNFAFDVRLVAQLDEQATASLPAIHVTGDIYRDVDVSPEEIDWGLLASGESVTATVTVFSYSGTPITIASASTDKADFQVIRDAPANTTACSLRITTVAGPPGLCEATLFIDVADPAGMNERLVVPLRYRSLNVSAKESHLEVKHGD